MNPNDISWNIDNPDDMVVKIRYRGTDLFSIGICEIIESSSRKKVLAHIAECDNTPWLRRWQDEKHQVVVDILKGDKCTT